MLEDRGYPMGCPRQDHLVLKARDELHGFPGILSVIRCDRCGLWRNNPRPPKQRLAKYYSREYRAYDFRTLDGSGRRIIGSVQEDRLIHFALYPIALLLASLRGTGRITVWAQKNSSK
jgi:hypothetical protein